MNPANAASAGFYAARVRDWGPDAVPRAFRSRPARGATSGLSKPSGRQRQPTNKPRRAHEHPPSSTADTAIVGLAARRSRKKRCDQSPPAWRCLTGPESPGPGLPPPMHGFEDSARATHSRDRGRPEPAHPLQDQRSRHRALTSSPVRAWRPRGRCRQRMRRSRATAASPSSESSFASRTPIRSSFRHFIARSGAHHAAELVLLLCNCCRLRLLQPARRRPGLRPSPAAASQIPQLAPHSASLPPSDARPPPLALRSLPFCTLYIPKLMYMYMTILNVHILPVKCILRGHRCRRDVALTVGKRGND